MHRLSFRSRLVGTAAALVTVAFGAASCSSSSTPPSSSTTSPTTANTNTSTTSASTSSDQTLRIALDFYANVDYLGIYDAISLGYFAKEHIKPVIIPYSGASAETLLQAGKTDLALTYPPNIPADRASGIKFSAVAGVTQVNTISLAVLASSPYKNVAQLSGKLYGGFGVPSDKAVITAMMKKAGVKDPVFDEVTLNTAAYTALEKGRVAYTTVFGGIDDVTANLEGIKLRIFPDKDYLGSTMSFPDDAFVANNSEISQDAGLLRRGSAALSEGYTFAAHNPARSEQILMNDNKTALANQNNIVVATGNIVARQFLSSSGTWGTMNDGDFSGITNLLFSSGIIKTKPPVSGDFTNSLLPSS